MRVLVALCMGYAGATWLRSFQTEFENKMLKLPEQAVPSVPPTMMQQTVPITDPPTDVPGTYSGEVVDDTGGPPVEKYKEMYLGIARGPNAQEVHQCKEFFGKKGGRVVEVPGVGIWPAEMGLGEDEVFRITTTFDFARRAAGRAGVRHRDVYADFSPEPALPWAVYAASLGLHVYVAATRLTRLTLCLNPNSFSFNFIPQGVNRIDGVHPLVLRTPFPFHHNATVAIRTAANKRFQGFQPRMGSCYGSQGLGVAFTCFVNVQILNFVRPMETRLTVEETARCAPELTKIGNDVKYSVYLMEHGLKMAFLPSKIITRTQWDMDKVVKMENFIEAEGSGYYAMLYAASGGREGAVLNINNIEVALGRLSSCLNPVVSGTVTFKLQGIGLSGPNCLVAVSTDGSRVVETTCRSRPWTYAEIRSKEAARPRTRLSRVQSYPLPLNFTYALCLSPPPVKITPSVAPYMFTQYPSANLSFTALADMGYKSIRIGSCGDHVRVVTPSEVDGLFSNNTAARLNLCFSA